jgi:hypothetical protein
MVMITDVTPTRSNMSFGASWQDVTGRMLSLASSDDGKLVFAGSLSSGLWVSEDGGKSWTQLVWEQPPPDQFGVPGALGGCCITSIAVGPESARWFVDEHLRFIADIAGDGAADIVGFGTTGVWTALSNGDGTFNPAQVVLADFCPRAGGWHIERHPRFLADITGTNGADIIGFGDAGVYVALSNGDGTFSFTPQPVIEDLGFESGGWKVEKHPRFVGDITGDGKADIVGFGDAGVYVALSNGDGTFDFTPRPVIEDFGFESGGWRVDKHPRFLADLTGTNGADIIGFGDAGVYVALSNGDGTFSFNPQPVIEDFGYDQGWRIDKHPRFLADITGDGKADIIGFGDAGVYVALNRGDGTFDFTPQPVIQDFGFESGGWRVDKHPRFLADITGANGADIIGFGDAGVYIARSRGDGTFDFTPQPVIEDFGFEAGGWRVDKHPRFLADITGEGRADIIGFGDAGVYVALPNTDGVFGPVRFVLPNFGNGLTVLALSRSDREANDAGVWRSTDCGSTWSLVYSFPRQGGVPAAGQLIWAEGTAHLVFAAGQTSLGVSRDGGATWQTATRQAGPIIGGATLVPANHVAVAATPAGTLRPPAVYALAANMIQVSLDGGSTWTPDAGTLPSPIGGPVGLFNSNNECVMVVSPRAPFEVFVTRDGSSAAYDPQLWRGDYSQFAQTRKSTWQELPIPSVGDQDSGNVWLAITRPGQGEALFYGPQRYFGNNVGEAWVAPLDLQSSSDWHKLGTGNRVHVDLHGMFLSPDFRAGFDGNDYKAAAGTVWLLSDGGIDRSTNGGNNFEPAGSISTLSTVNFAGAAVPGKGPLLSLNTGDNDGFASRDGGKTWRTQQYGGGDNDTSWSDPLQPHSMLIFTPRWNDHGGPANGKGQTLALYETDPGNLPDISSSDDRQMIPGPPLRPGTVLWNATSSFAQRVTGRWFTTRRPTMRASRQMLSSSATSAISSEMVRRYIPTIWQFFCAPATSEK